MVLSIYHRYHVFNIFLECDIREAVFENFSEIERKNTLACEETIDNVVSFVQFLHVGSLRNFRNTLGNFLQMALHNVRYRTQ